MRRKAKIGGTLGPACDDEVTLARLVRAGLDVARLNFSHGEPAEHRRRVRRLRRVVRVADRPVALLGDLQGPRFRVGELAQGQLHLVEGSSVELVAGRSRSRPGSIPVSYAALAGDVRRGHSILLDDGKLCLEVERVRGESVWCSVVRGGELTDHKGINLPGSSLSVPTLTVKDRRDLRLAVELGADWLAVSFVRSAEDVRLARRLLLRAGRALPVMAKIERAEAIDRLEEILEAADGLLVARGDLGVELPVERVPLLQKQIIEAANGAGRPVMTATQMLESMRESSRPTRAEATDVANAVLDGSSSLLLTAETAAGRHPVEAVEMMARIVEQAESAERTHVPFPPRERLTIPLTTCRAACRAAFDVGAAALVVFTQSGFSALQTSRFRPATPIVAFTPSARVARQLCLSWGIEPRVLPARKSVEQLLEAAEAVLLAERRIVPGDVLVVLSGSPVGLVGSTNLIQLHRVGGTPFAEEEEQALAGQLVRPRPPRA